MGGPLGVPDPRRLAELEEHVAAVRADVVPAGMRRCSGCGLLVDVADDRTDCRHSMSLPARREREALVDEALREEQALAGRPAGALRDMMKKRF